MAYVLTDTHPHTHAHWSAEKREILKDIKKRANQEIKTRAQTGQVRDGERETA